MFPTCISFLDIQSWWEVPSIAHFCSLFRTTFNLLDFDIEDLEEALLADGTEETSWLQELIVLLLKGCQPRNEISVSNYQMFLRRLFRRKCQQHNITNPFNTDIDFQLLPLRAKVVILSTLCDFRLDAADVIGQLRKLEADSLRVEPLGYDSNKSAYWYFYGTRLYREDKPKSKNPIWQVVCFTLNDWTQLAKKFENSKCRAECQLSYTLNENFLPELPSLFNEKESLARKRLIERLPRRSSNRLKNKVEEDQFLQRKVLTSQTGFDEESRWRIEPDKKHQEENIREHRSKTYERLRRRDLRQLREHVESDFSDDGRYEMAGAKGKDKKTKGSPKQKKDDGRDVSSRRSGSAVGNKNAKGNDGKDSKPVGRQTNNSLASATGQILIQPVSNPHRKKMKTSQVFSQSEEDLQTGLHKILDHVKNHDDAWPFIDPVEEEYAPNYYSIIRKPMDLQSMEDRLDSGHYKTYSKFKTDFQLIVDNCRLYNGADNEYTEMVDNLLEVFNCAVEKYLEQITSSDEEIAVEYPNADKDKANKKKKCDVVVSGTKRKPSLAVQPDRKKERSPSEESLHSIEDIKEVDDIKVNKSIKKTGKGPGRGRGRKPREIPFEEKVTKLKKTETKSNKKLDLVKIKEAKKEDKSKSKQEEKVKKTDKAVKDNDKRKQDETTEKVNKMKKVKKSELPKSKKPEPEKTKKCQVDEVKNKKDLKSKTTVAKIKKSDQVEEMKKAKSITASKKSDKKAAVCKPKVEEKKKVAKKRKRSPSMSSPERRKSKSPTREPWSVSPPPSWPPSSPENNSKKKDSAVKDVVNEIGKNKVKNDLSKETVNEDKDKKTDCEVPKHKDKHNKLRETIEKLKAKSDMTKLSKDMKVFEFESEKPKDIKKDHVDLKKKAKISKKDDYEDGNSTADSVQSDKKSKKKSGNNSKPLEYDALNLATEQTLKDINKWLDSSPSFTSASNSPSHFGDEVDPIKISVEIDKKKVEKPVVPKKDVGKETKKRPFQRDPNKRRKEVQRTIDRLQPGKSKGNLITNVQSTAKTDDIFPLGPLSKIKDTKNSLIVKTDDTAPKLSLGSVLDSFGEHKFVDDEIKESKLKDVEDTKKTDVLADAEKKIGENSVEKECVKDEAKVEPIKLDNSPGVATPNLSAWFKAFGAPKVQPSTTKKPEKEEKIEEVKKDEVKKVVVAEPSPNSDNLVMQVGQPIARQRKVSTGSSISERSSFSQDMDSPRVGIDERIGAYPAPYPSPLHKSPSGASPNLPSPRPDVSPKYNFNNGQIRVGFYQDTVSTKSSPEKSCSPRDNPQSPYSQYGEMYPNNQNYSYTNPYYPPNYSTSNPTPPYNNEQSNQGYYDQTKSVNSPVNSPVAHSPINQQDSPTINQPQQSPSLSQQNSPSVDSYQQNSPNMDILSMEGYQRQNQSQLPSPNYNRQGQQQQGMAIQHKQNIQETQAMTHQQISPKYQQQDNMQLHVPKIDHNAMQSQEPQQERQLSRQMTQMHQTMFTQQQRHMIHPQQQQQQQQTPPSQQQNELYSLDNYRNSQTLDPNYRQSPQMINETQQQQHIVKQQNASAPPPTTFPVKKRAYSEIDQFQEQQFTTRNIEAPVIMANRLEPVNATEQGQGAKYVHQNIPEPRSMPNSQMIQNQSSAGVILNTTGGPQQDNAALRNFSPTVSNPYNYNTDSYPLNIPSRALQQERKTTDLSKFADMQQARKSTDLSKFTDMPAYNSAAGMDFTRNTTQFNKPDLNFPKATIQNVQTSEQQIRFPDAATNMINYKSSQAPNQPTTSLSEVSIPRPTYSAPTTLEMDLRGNLANLSHIVERYPNDERVLPGLQSSAPPAYNMTPAQHMFSKPNASMFTQPNSMPAYTHNIQNNAMYNRPMSEIQGPAPVNMMGQDRNAGVNTPTLQQQMQEKKTKRRKTTKAVNPTPSTVMETNPTAVSTQGFQSYKNPGSMEPSAISLKTASVPGSAFNFGPTAPGLGLGTGLSDAYPNYLEDFRSAPQLLYAHHRTTPTEGGSEKPAANVRTAHQSTNPQPPAPGYTFLGTPQSRPGYPPLGGHFMPPPPHHQGTLMDASSPLYQQYLQAGVLHQGLLAPGAYPPPGYLSIRQPYDPMSRSFY
ncbi:PREDICTED: uncharacterized protein LOC108565750 isoform X2 [Nicrophorus vespilloides]|uniref:Uncharacterized protein LOC108565750 isoform X2 n=1 Tax=Nicrophorus vespilloides TaxID=110193 RepID=A0ABM1N1Y5_NICVS|nr:PREDICTED: uncharacterized protein LOC108565750 isoform X2 [Nicrophorus vespilloides]